MIFKKIVSIIGFILLFTSISFAEIFINDVQVVGNKTINKNTILSISGIKKSSFITNTDDLNAIQKRLFASNFFSLVRINVKDKILLIDVIENPTVEYVVIDGMDKRKDLKTNIEKLLYLKQNNLFSESLLNKDKALIKENLNNQGFLNAEVDFLVKKINDNNVNVFYNVKLNNQYSVNKIFFIGNKKFSSSELLSIITTSEDSWFSFFSTTSIPSLDRLSYDVNLLKNFYLSEGYYDVQISNASMEIVNENHVNVFISIDSGNKFLVSDYKLNVESSSIGKKDFENIKFEINKIINNYYDIKKINLTKNNIYKILDSKNISSLVNYNIIKSDQDKLVVFFSIKENTNKVYINNIIVKGNNITEEKVIRNNLFFAEGDIYYDFKINKSIDLLKSLGLFKNVNYVEKKIENSNNINIEINIEEQPTGEISSGVGVGSAGSNISFNLKEKNFLGKGITTNIELNLGTQSSTGSISFTDPDFNDSGNSFRNSAYVTNTTYNNSGYENKLIGNKSSYGYELFEDVNFENGLAIDIDSVSVNDTAKNLIKSQAGDYLTTKYFYSALKDKRNRKYKPSEGYTVGITQDLAFFPSDIKYIYNSFFGSYYKTFTEDFIGSIKYKIKSINSFNSDSIKLSDRVFLSDTELRGFAYRGIGPKAEGDFIGGNYAISSTFASSIPNGLPDTWNALTSFFFDIGNVWGSDINGIDDSNKIRSSIGFGVTWSSPLGPISLSYAEPISKANTDSIENFNFKLGGVF